MSTAIERYELSKRYWRVSALTECTVTVPEGRGSALAGPNGAGKPVTELRHSLLACPADCRLPGQRSSSRTRPPS